MNAQHLNDEAQKVKAWSIFGIGSPIGDDQAGWQVATALRERDPELVRMESVRVPLDLLHVLDQCERIVIIDACRIIGIEEAGDRALPERILDCDRARVYQWHWPSAKLSSARWLNSHGVGVVQVLELADELGILPSEVIVFGIEVIGDVVCETEMPAVVRSPHLDPDWKSIAECIWQKLHVELEAV